LNVINKQRKSHKKKLNLLMNISSVQQICGPNVQVNHYCLECSKEIEKPVTFLGVEASFCEECEIDDYEGKCNKGWDC
jgi:hypothetical protein